MPPYKAQFPVGTRVRIASAADLDAFRRTWTLHNPLTDQQLPFAGHEATVAEVGFYHGGDPLYSLRQVPGAWHEVCLAAIPVPAV